MAYWDRSYSSSGATGRWSLAVGVDALEGFKPSAIILVDGKPEDFIAVGSGNDGNGSGTIAAGAKYIGRIQWTNVPTHPFTGKINDIASDGDGHYVVVGAGGKIAYSAGGSSWTPAYDNRVFGSSDSIEGVAYGKGYFVAVGTGGKMAGSADNGKTWVNISDTVSSSITCLYDVLYAEGRFVAVGSQGAIIYSDNVYVPVPPPDTTPLPPPADTIDYTVQMIKVSNGSTISHVLVCEFAEEVPGLVAQQIHIASDTGAVTTRYFEQSTTPIAYRYVLHDLKAGNIKVWIGKPGVNPGTKTVPVWW
jgi:hypothetical protein